MPDDRLLHALTDQEHERLFRQRIAPVYLDASSPIAEPVAVILGGQPGSGKTLLLHDATRALQSSGSTVVINGDDLRAYHPAYGQLQTNDPLNAARYTDHDSGRWVEKLIAAAQERRVNLVIESTMRRPEVFATTSTQLAVSGYRVEAHVLAVTERLSWQGVHQRFEAMLAQGGSARFSAREAHDAGASGMLVTLFQIERDRLADRVLLATREGAVLYDNRLQPTGWRTPPQASEIVQAERARPRSPDELAHMERSWLGVIDSMQRRSAAAADLDRVVDQAASDILHFRGPQGRVATAPVTAELAGIPAALLEAAIRHKEGIAAGPGHAPDPQPVDIAASIQGLHGDPGLLRQAVATTMRPTGDIGRPAPSEDPFERPLTPLVERHKAFRDAMAAERAKTSSPATKPDEPASPSPGPRSSRSSEPGPD